MLRERLWEKMFRAVPRAVHKSLAFKGIVVISIVVPHMWPVTSNGEGGTAAHGTTT